VRVSIVIPTFNRAVYLEGAISSALEQDYEDLEIVIADNASTDNTEAVAKVYSRDPRVKYFRNDENIGMVRNWRKTVFERTTGDWFLILSDDDILMNPRFISQAVGLIKANPDMTVVYASSYIYDEGMNTVSKLKIPFAQVESGLHVFSRRGTVRPQDFALCNVLFNKSLSIANNAFSNPANLSCDTELFLRLCLRGNVGVVNEWSSIYRVHSDNLLKSVNRNMDFIIGSLDSLLVPLLDARAIGVNRDSINNFIHNSGIRKEILVTLLKASLISKNQARSLYVDLRKTAGTLAPALIPNRLFFFALVLMSKCSTPLFVVRRRMLYLLNAFRRMFFGNQIYFEPLHRKVFVID
jgi:glycosyltransferase involved in cell wall biosynthesis